MKPRIQKNNVLMPVKSMRLVALAVAASLACEVAYAAPGDAPEGPPALPSANLPEQMLGGGGYQYLWLPGSVFHPFQTGAAFSYTGSGCIHATGGTEKRFAHKVVLPAGSVVKFVRLYAYDNSASSAITAFFTTYDGGGDFTELISVDSTNAGGYVSNLGPEMNYTINGLLESANIVANLGTQNDNSLQFCGVRIAYISDLIFENGFE